jgi:hypothetical protein
MSEVKGFYEHLQDVPNPNVEGSTKGTLEEFDFNAGIMAAEALRRTGVEMVEYDVRSDDRTRIEEIETNVESWNKEKNDE